MKILLGKENKEACDKLIELQSLVNQLMYSDDKDEKHNYWLWASKHIADILDLITTQEMQERYEPEWETALGQGHREDKYGRN